MDVRTLADLMPAVATSLDVGPDPSGDNPVITPNRDVVLLLVDGLGARLLEEHGDVAPNLIACSRGRLTAGFPATTASSLSTLATGSPCASHGIIGYSFAVDRLAAGHASADQEQGPRRFNALRWRLDSAEGPDARELYSPEDFQRTPSVFSALADAGIDVHYVMPPELKDSGLTRAAFRAAGTLHPATTLAQLRDETLAIVAGEGKDAPGQGSRRFVYAYYPVLDATGHLEGPGTTNWRAVLADIDRIVADLVSDLPATTTLVATGDHGMIKVGNMIDLDARDDLRRGVRLIAGEARVRHLYLDDPATAPQIGQLWADELAADATIATREQVLDERWYGDVTRDPAISRRIGDLVAVARGTSVLICPQHEPIESILQGHHGAGTDDEVLVPLLVSPR